MKWTFALPIGSMALQTACAGVLGLDDFAAGEGGANPAGSQASTGNEVASSSAASSTSTTQSVSSSGSSTGQGGDGGGTGGGGGDGGTGGTGGGGGTGGEGGNPPDPTCRDDVQNGNEGGVDCGGDCPPCEIVCPATTHLCAPPVAGWTGPVALIDSDIGCGAPFPQMQVELHAGLGVLPSSCDCGCGAPNVACGDRVTVIDATESTCQNTQGGDSALVGSCLRTPGSFSLLSIANPTSTCGAGAVTADNPEPTWDTSLMACDGFGEAGTCDGDAVCMPSPIVPFEDAQICVVHVGETTCPSGYPNPRAYHERFADTRECPATCSCTASGAVCRTNLLRYSASDCGSGALGSAIIRSGSPRCETGTTNSVQSNSIFVETAGTCSGVDPAPTGSVEEAAPYTVCCM